MMARTPATVTVELATGELTGLFTFDESLFDGDDVFAGDFGGNVFFDLTGRDQHIVITRGSNADLAGIREGTAAIRLTDEDGDFNPENPASPIADDLDVMLPLRIQGTHPELFEGYETTVLADSPSGYWRLGEASGALARDSSGNGLDGAYIGGVTLGQAGALTDDADTAALFDGSTGYVSVPHAAALAITGDLTIEAWVNTDVLDFKTIVSKSVGGVAAPYYLIINASGALRLRLGNGVADAVAGSNNGILTAGGGLVHVAVTVSGTSVTFYANGVQAGTATLSTTVADGGGTVEIGRRQDPGLYWDGTLDEVAIYPTALSAARILAHYEAGRATGGDARTAGLFYGFLRDYEHDPDLNVRKSFLNAVDFFEWLGTIKPVIASTGPISEGDAIGMILDAAQWTDPTLRDLDAGGTLADFSADGTQTGIALVSGIQQISLGLFFVKGDGVVRYLSRESRFAPQSPIATLNGSLITGVRPRRSVDQVKNRISVTRTSGSPQEATNDDSRRRYGYRDADPIESAYFVSDADALGLAQLYVLLYGEPRAPIRQVRLINRDDESILLQLTLEIGNRVTVSESSGGTDAEGEIVGIQHRFPGSGIHETLYLVSTVASSIQFFTFDDPTGASVFDGTAVFAY